MVIMLDCNIPLHLILLVKSENIVTPARLFTLDNYHPDDAEKNSLEKLRFLGPFPEYIPPGGLKEEE